MDTNEIINHVAGVVICVGIPLALGLFGYLGLVALAGGLK